ncbi:MAG: fibronectin type III domain-containing protein [Weeksellaceae bacterium]
MYWYRLLLNKITKSRRTAVIGISLFFSFLLLFIFIDNNYIFASESHTISTRADFNTGFYTDAESKTKEGQIQLDGGGSWDARSWKTPFATQNDGTILADDGIYTYMLLSRDVRFTRYLPDENRWQTLASAPFMPYIGADMVYLNGYVYVVFGGYQKEFARYSIATNTWETLDSLPDLIYSGASIQTDGTNIYVLRGTSTTDFWKYTVSTEAWSTLAAPPATISAGADLVFDTTGPDYLYTPRGTATNTFYRYDIAGNSWSAMTNAPATLASTGNLTKVGDYIYVMRGSATNTFYRYSMSGNSWATLSVTPQTTNSVGLIYNAAEDLIYVFRGNNTYDWWKYDPDAGTFAGPTELPATAGLGADLNYLSNYVYYRRGLNTTSFYRLDTVGAGATWATLAAAPAAFTDDTKGITAGSYIYYLRGSATTTMYRYNPSLGVGGTWTTMAAAPATISYGASLAYPGSGDYIYATRGTLTTSFYRYSISGDSWSDVAVADLPTDSESGYGGRLTSDGTYIYAMTGSGIANFHRYDISGNTWSSLGSVPFAPYYGSDLVYYSGKIYALGGYYKNDLWEYNISAGSWRRLPDNQGYYEQNIGAYAGASLGVNSSTGTLYAILGNSLSQLTTFTVSANAYPTSGNWVSNPLDLSYVSSWNTLTATTSTPSDSSVTIQTRSSADKTTWTGWQTVSGGTIASTAQRYLQIRATLTASTDQASTPIVSAINVSYEGDAVVPSNPSSFTGSSQAVGGVSISTGSTYVYNNPYFSWTGASDGETSVAGYYVYFGTNASADPETAGTFQTAANYTVTSALSTGTYYLRVKTEDQSGNLAAATTGFTYVYNGVSPPQAVSFTTTADFSTGVGDSVSSTSDEIKLQGKAGYWMEKRLSLAPSTFNYGAGLAYVSSSNKLYTFRGNNTNTFYEYNITTDTWTTLANAPAVVFNGGDLVEGPSGYIYGAPGRALNTFWRYDIEANTWDDAAASDPPLSLNYGTSFIYDGTRYIYALRGNSDDAFMRYDTQLDTWDTLANTDFGSPTDRLNNNVYIGGDLSYDLNNTIYAIQGNTLNGFSAYSISGNSWTVLPDLPALAYEGSQITYDSESNAIYFTSGWTNPFFYKYDIASETWTKLNDSPATFGAGGVLKTVDGIIYAIRGITTNIMWRYNIEKASWEIPSVRLFGTEFRGTDYLGFSTGADLIRGDGNYFYMTRGNYDNLFVRYNSVTGESVHMAPAPAGFFTGGSMVYDSTANKIYAIPSLYVRRMFVYDIATDSWSEETSDLPPFDVGAGTSMAYDGSRYIYWTRGGLTTGFYRFDTQGAPGAKWAVRAVAPATIGAGSDIIYQDGYVYALRGGTTVSFYRYDVNANTWSDPAVADLSTGVTVGADGFLIKGDGSYFYACRGLNTSSCYRYSVSGNAWTAVENAPANITTGGAAASNTSNKIFMIAGPGTNTYANGLFTYVMETTSSSFVDSGTFSSDGHDLGTVYKFANLSINYTTGTNAALHAYTRTSEDDITYSSWSEASELKLNNTTYTYKVNSPIHRYIEVKFELTSADGVASGVVSDYSINYYQDPAAPTNPTSLTAYNSGIGSTELSTNTWYNHTTPRFDWPDAEAVGGASDTSTGSGIQGYYVYFGDDSAADPQEDGTLITASEYTAASLVSGETYYLRIKAVDNANNVDATTWQPFIYKLDTVAPTNPTTVVSNPPGYTATNSYTFSWSGAIDTGSGLGGYCYKTGELGSSDTCISAATIAGLTAYQTGSNTFYVRARDAAGNLSSTYVNASYYYSSVAPGAPQNLEVDPASNTLNSFSFTWEPPELYYGSQAGLRYFYSVNALPTNTNVNAVGLENPYLAAGAYATQKDTNTMYVVAKDEAGNINYNNYAAVDFEADTSSPGMPVDLEIADVSVKETENWKLAVSWEPPTDTGSGLSVYKVYRSATAGAVCTDSFDSFEYISSTTGKSFVDTDLEQQEYGYCVKACTSTNDCSAPSDTMALIPDGRWRVAPELIGEPDVTVKTRSSVISWATDREASSFVKYGKKSGDYGAEVGSSDQETDHEIELLSLDPGTKYYFKVVWTDEDGNTDASDEYSFTTNAAPFVSAVKVTSVSLYDAYVSFTVKNAIKATVQYGKTAAYGTVESISTSKSETTYTAQLKELIDGTTYHLRIVAEDDEGNTYNGDDYTFETLPVPKVTTLRVQQVEGMPSATLRLIWASNTRLSSVVTYYPSGKPELSKDFINLTPKTRHEAILRDLQDETAYTILVRGKDPVGNEAKYTPQNVTTASDLRAPLVQNVNVESTIVGVGEDARAQILISWDTDESASSQIEYGEGTGGVYSSTTQADPSMTNNHAVTIPGLQPSKIYHFRIISGDKNKNKGLSQDVVVITPNATKDALNLVVDKLSTTFGFLKQFQAK